jgi:hypothetical protein
LEQGVPQKINSRASIVHNIYKNDLSLRISSISEPILFADGTFQADISQISAHIKFNSLSYD